MNYELNFRVRPIFEKIKAGLKTVETRALNPEEPWRYFGNIKKGDLITCHCKNTDEIITKVVKDIRVYPDFEGYLDKEDLSKVYGGKTSKQEMRKIHLSFPGYETKLRENGIVAIEFENE